MWESFFATCAKGTELVLKEELRELGLRRVRADRGGVRFEGPLTDAFRACLHSRIAVRVLWPIARFSAPDSDALYEGVRAFAWEQVVTPRHTLAVSAISKNSALGHTAFVAQRTKDAIVDRLRGLGGERPSVDKHDPDLGIFVHLAKDEAGVHLDLGGQSLHRRGWRSAIGEAPLKETLAAAILRASGWDRERPLLDPMCGSGTIAIEADLWARRIAPNLARERFGFERWASHDERQRDAMKLLREQARDEELRDGPTVFGSDRDPHAIATAEGNARRAGSRVRWTRMALRDRAGTTPPGHIVSNPPYGIRLTDVDAMWRELAEALPRLAGHRLSLLLQAPPPPGLLPPPATLHAVWNGAIECRLADWDL
jgi:23S rRNA (guanine2445-N2)-methyltransferase / 23S rRNA (guanine2069-N7)-methyltransferase